jgi:signal transduction histidine kinase/ActR/RegA family two-component response regulator
LGENLIKVSSGREALACLLRTEVAVILVDVVMPELDGFELAAMLREHPRFQETAIIFVSAIAMTDLDRVKGYESGAVDYVPVVPEVLRAKVRVFADLYRKTRQLAHLNAELEERVADRTAALESTAAALAAANADLERRVEERTREREAAFAQLHEMQKVESLGQLTGGVAHDFNNLLMVVLGNLQLLRKRLPDDPALLRLVDGAIQGGERGAALTKRMLAFARRQELKPDVVDVPKLVGGMTDLMRRTLGPTIEITAALKDGLAPVFMDPGQLELALLNLAVNARDAMPQGGSLVISAQPGAVGTKGASVEGLAAGEYVCIAVSDTGTGMDDATRRRAIEPFFTTKGVGKGTGLGLSMVHGLAAQSGGAMRIESRLSEGTTVELWLPVAPEAARPGRLESSVAPLVIEAATACRVLVVDDDVLVLAGTAAMLEDLGHSTVKKSSGMEALEFLNSGEEVDLVVTDHAMPGMTGVELARHIHQAWPLLPVLLASGYAELPNEQALDLPRLSKPYRQDELAAQITMLLDAKTNSNVLPSMKSRRSQIRLSGNDEAR